MKRAVVPVVAVLALGLTTVAAATKPPSGSSSGTGLVFFPNPVASLGNETLTDQKDADYAALAPAYETVTLTNLDGSGYLRGDWANVRGETGPAAYSPTTRSRTAATTIASSRSWRTTGSPRRRGTSRASASVPRSDR